MNTYDWDKLFGDWETVTLFNDRPALKKEQICIPPLFGCWPSKYRWLKDLPEEAQKSFDHYVYERFEKKKKENKQAREHAAMEKLVVAGVVLEDNT